MQSIPKHRMARRIALLWCIALVLPPVSRLRAQPVELTASDASALAFFGYAVAVSGDYIVVGMPGEDADTGAAYVFVKDPAEGWTQQIKLAADAPTIGDAFGFSVDIDGAVLVVGAPGEDDNGNDAGAAYVFVKEGEDGWNRQAKLIADDGASEDRLGYSVALSGLFVMAGAPGHDDGAVDTGAAYAFTFNGQTWQQQDKLSPISANERDFFGEAVALDDDTALIGAPLADEPRGLDTGLAFLFVRSGTAWLERATLTASNAASNRRFGAAVALGTEPLRNVSFAVVGAPGASASSVGRSYVFAEREMVWTQVAQLAPDVVVSGSHFGTSAALNGDVAAIGAEDANLVTPHPGAVHLFAEDAFNDWPRQTTLTAPGAEVGADFGTAVALSDVYLVVGAPRNARATEGEGAVYVFDRSSLNTATEIRPERLSSKSTQYPNPFRRTTTIAFEIEAAAPVTLTVYDVLGRIVETLVDKRMEPGRHQIIWRANTAPSGLYLYRLQIGSKVQTRPMLLIR